MELNGSEIHLPEIAAAYVLLGQNGKYYRGACRSLPRRMSDHRCGIVSRTKGQRPLRLVYYEECRDYEHALERETFLKSGVGRQLLKCQLADPEEFILPGWRHRHTQQTSR